MTKRIFKLEGCIKKGKIRCKGQGGKSAIVDIEIKNKKSDEFLAAFACECIKQSVTHKKNDKIILIENDIITDKKIPVLFFYPESAKHMPLVLLVHGFDSEKKWCIKHGIRLAEEGFCSLILDARMHGERRPVDFNLKFNSKNYANNIFNVIKGTAEDITHLIDYMGSDKRINVDRIGMMGISMGGFICFLTATIEKRIKAFTPLLASPDWSEVVEDRADVNKPNRKTAKYIRNYDPLSNYNKFFPSALLVQNGTDDRVVSIAGSRKLDKKLKQCYKGIPDRYEFIEYSNTAHEVTPIMVKNVIEWFKRIL